MSKSEAERIFEEYRKHLISEAMRLTQYVVVYRTLEERRSDRLSEMNMAPAFFGTVIDALLRVLGRGRHETH